MNDHQKIIEETIAKVNSSSLLDSLLDNFTARDLITALHWTSKDDLKQCLQEGDNLDEYWDNLVKADEALKQFLNSDLARIIQLNYQLKQHER